LKHFDSLLKLVTGLAHTSAELDHISPRFESLFNLVNLVTMLGPFCIDLANKSKVGLKVLGFTLNIIKGCLQGVLILLHHSAFPHLHNLANVFLPKKALHGCKVRVLQLRPQIGVILQTYPVKAVLPK